MRFAKSGTQLRAGSVFAALGAAFAGAAYADPPTVGDIPIEFSGFLNVDYGAGDRYDGVSGSDRAGVSKAALAAKATYEKTSATVVFGTGDLTGNTSGDFDGDVFLVNAFVAGGDFAGVTGLTVSAGLQPILFGLHPNGFPGDRSLQGSVEFGGGGQFAVSNQGGAAVVARYKLNETVMLEAGTFDSDAGTLAPPDGSQITDNNFVQARFNNIGGSGLYGVVGAERRYVGATDSSEPILDAGIGWAGGMFDVSAELVWLDQTIAGTADDEQYAIIEAALAPYSGMKFYADWAQATEADVNTYRLGGKFDINKLLMFQLEYSRDELSAGDVDSIDARIKASF